MTDVTNFVNEQIAAVKARRAETQSSRNSVHSTFNGHSLTVSALTINTQTKNNQLQIKFKVDGKVVSAAKVSAALTA